MFKKCSDILASALFSQLNCLLFTEEQDTKIRYTQVYVFRIKATTYVANRLGFVYLKAGLVARSRHPSGGSCDWPAWARLSVIFLGPGGNVELVPKLHVALLDSYAVFLPLNSNFPPKRNSLSECYQSFVIMHRCTCKNSTILKTQRLLSYSSLFLPNHG